LTLTYHFTTNVAVAYRNYKLSLSGYVKPAHGPGRKLLGDSIKRARAQIADAKKEEVEELTDRGIEVSGH